jgi:broad specificity phosphatase PhoE
MNKQITFIRHGKSTHNVDYHERGEIVFMDPKHEDANLTDLGIEQSKELGRTIDTFDLVVCSPLSRTLQTALNVFGEIPIIVLDELMEYPLGSHTPNKRKKKTELIKLYPSCFNFDNIFENPPDFNKPEECQDLKLRIQAFNDWLMKRPETKIAVVGHCSFLSVFLNISKTMIKHCSPIRQTF